MRMRALNTDMVSGRTCFRDVRNARQGLLSGAVMRAMRRSRGENAPQTRNATGELENAGIDHVTPPSDLCVASGDVLA